MPEPKIAEWLLWIWRAWWRLHADRPWQGGGLGAAVPGRIAWRDVIAWCDFHGYSGEDAVFMDRCFADMDAEFFKWHAARAARPGG